MSRKTSKTSTPRLTNESIKCTVNIDFHNLSLATCVPISYIKACRIFVAIIWKQDLGGVTESRK